MLLRWIYSKPHCRGGQQRTLLSGNVTEFDFHCSCLWGLYFVDLCIKVADFGTKFVPGFHLLVIILTIYTSKFYCTKPHFCGIVTYKRCIYVWNLLKFGESLMTLRTCGVKLFPYHLITYFNQCFLSPITLFICTT